MDQLRFSSPTAPQGLIPGIASCRGLNAWGPGLAAPRPAEQEAGRNIAGTWQQYRSNIAAISQQYCSHIAELLLLPSASLRVPGAVLTAAELCFCHSLSRLLHQLCPPGRVGEARRATPGVFCWGRRRVHGSGGWEDDTRVGHCPGEFRAPSHARRLKERRDHRGSRRCEDIQGDAGTAEISRDMQGSAGRCRAVQGDARRCRQL